METLGCFLVHGRTLLFMESFQPGDKKDTNTTFRDRDRRTRRRSVLASGLTRRLLWGCALWRFSAKTSHPWASSPPCCSPSFRHSRIDIPSHHEELPREPIEPGDPAWIPDLDLLLTKGTTRRRIHHATLSRASGFCATTFTTTQSLTDEQQQQEEEEEVLSVVEDDHPSPPLTTEIPRASRRRPGNSKSPYSDPWVWAAPLLVAAVCRDGLALVAAHTLDGDQEPLLYHRHNDDEYDDDEEQDDHQEPPLRDHIHTFSTTSFGNDDLSGFQDLPRGYGGPWRIECLASSIRSTTTSSCQDPVATMVTVAASTGWRADADRWIRQARVWLQQDRQQFGSHHTTTPLYAPWALQQTTSLATDLSFLLAQYAVSERFRPWSCVGLLASTWTKPGMNPSSYSRLYLIDATGAYQVRAVAVGGGMVENDPPGQGQASTRAGMELTAAVVNRRLLNTDFSNLTAVEGLGQLIRILSNHPDDDDDDLPEQDTAPRSPGKPRPLLHPQTRLELVTLHGTSSQGGAQMVRHQLASCRHARRPRAEAEPSA